MGPVYQPMCPKKCVMCATQRNPILLIFEICQAIPRQCGDTNDTAFIDPTPIVGAWAKLSN